MKWTLLAVACIFVAAGCSGGDATTKEERKAEKPMTSKMAKASAGGGPSTPAPSTPAPSGSTTQ